MDGERIAQALARIEAAAGRIEAARPVATSTNPALQAKYDRLRREAGNALAEIDRLLERLEQ